MAVHGSVQVSYATLAEALGITRAIGRSSREPVSVESRAAQLEALIEDLLARCEEHRPAVEEWTADRHMDRPPVTRRARELAATAGRHFTADSDLAVAIGDAERQLRAANDRLWVGLHPDGDHPEFEAIRLDAAIATGSEVLSSSDPLGAVQETHWAIHEALVALQHAHEDRRQLTIPITETVIGIADELAACGWTGEQVDIVNVNDLARDLDDGDDQR